MKFVKKWTFIKKTKNSNKGIKKRPYVDKNQKYYAILLLSFLTYSTYAFYFDQDSFFCYIGYILYSLLEKGIFVLIALSATGVYFSFKKRNNLWFQSAFICILAPFIQIISIPKNISIMSIALGFWMLLQAYDVNIFKLLVKRLFKNTALNGLWSFRDLKTPSEDKCSKDNLETLKPKEIEEDSNQFLTLPTKKIKHPKQEKPIFERENKSQTNTLPSYDLLNHPKNTASVSWDKAKVQSQLEQVLQHFSVKGKITKSSVGPVVTLFEFEPAPGVKAQRIINLASDIARSMSAQSARIAPILDKGVIGIELSNPKREIVHLRQIIDTPEYNNSDKLMLILGSDIGGFSVIANLAQMPHMLMAGTTGSGKSVVIHTLLLSLLFKHSPENCKLLLIDPKMLELSTYQNLPHLITPVIIEPKKAINALKWAVREMEQRYKMMAEIGVRNLDAYNAKIILKEQNHANEEKFKEKLPYIVVVIDEFADLMLVAGKEIESLIQRLAQMARAAGIHVILATQRPSVDVITGTIKANFPTRIALQVATRIDARTVLGDHEGAEQLLGKGDMLFLGASKLQRVHGPYVSEEEVERVVNFWKQQQEPSFINMEEEMSLESGQADDLTTQVWEFIQQSKRVSTSSVQRQFGIGFNRAAKCLESLEKMGKITPQDSMGRRKIA